MNPGFGLISLNSVAKNLNSFLEYIIIGFYNLSFQYRFDDSGHLFGTLKFSQNFMFQTLCIDCRRHFMLLITKNQLNSQIEGYKYFPSSSLIRNVIIQKDM